MTGFVIAPFLAIGIWLLELVITMHYQKGIIMGGVAFIGFNRTRLAYSIVYATLLIVTTHYTNKQMNKTGRKKSILTITSVLYSLLFIAVLIVSHAKDLNSIDAIEVNLSVSLYFHSNYYNSWHMALQVQTGVRK